MDYLISPEEFMETLGLPSDFQEYVDLSEASRKRRSQLDLDGSPYIAEVKQAILNRSYVGIYYEETKETGIVKSGFRLIEPYAYGLGYVHPQSGNVSHPNRQYMRAFVIMDTEEDDRTKDKFPTKRTSVSLTNREPYFRLFRLDRISSWRTFPKKFSRYRPLYNPSDKMMRRVLASLQYHEFPYGSI